MHCVLITDVSMCIKNIVEIVVSTCNRFPAARDCSYEMECDSLSVTWFRRAVMALTCEQVPLQPGDLYNKTGGQPQLMGS